MALDIIPEAIVRSALAAGEINPIENARRTYLAHALNNAGGPQSTFLRFPSRERDRIIALPAWLHRNGQEIAGIKWVSSFPDNHKLGLARASAVIVLNDMETGRCIACMDGTLISATRTAASAVVAARALKDSSRCSTISFIGCGPIASAIEAMFRSDCWGFDAICVHDLNHAKANNFAERLRKIWPEATSITATSREAALASSIVVLATNVQKPYLSSLGSDNTSQLVLNVSLRDVFPELILASDNIVDDVEHCLQANTSVHLAQKVVGNSDFICGTIAQAITGSIFLTPGKPTILSPFGLGILDLALAEEIYQYAKGKGEVVSIENFQS